MTSKVKGNPTEWITKRRDPTSRSREIEDLSRRVGRQEGPSRGGDDHGMYI